MVVKVRTNYLVPLVIVLCAVLLVACADEKETPIPEHHYASGSSTETTTAEETTSSIAPGADLTIPASAPLDGPRPGHYKRINLASGRHFILHVPEKYDASRAWPVVMAFHGWKETSWSIYSYSQLKAADAITVYPQGYKRAWAPAPYAETTGKEDIEFVSDIIDAIRATYSVDDSRIYATGMSNGGGFAAYLACQMPGVVSSVATISAAYYETIHKDCLGLPVGRFDIHGTYDPIVDYYGGRRHGARYVAVTDVMAMDAARNRCSDEVRTTRLKNRSLQQTWVGCQAPLEHIRIGGGQHVWPGGTADKTSSVGKGFATDKVLDFFAIPGRPEGTVDN